MNCKSIRYLYYSQTYSKMFSIKSARQLVSQIENQLFRKTYRQITLKANEDPESFVGDQNEGCHIKAQQEEVFGRQNMRVINIKSIMVEQDRIANQVDESMFENQPSHKQQSLYRQTYNINSLQKPEQCQEEKESQGKEAAEQNYQDRLFTKFKKVFSKYIIQNFNKLSRSNLRDMFGQKYHELSEHSKALQINETAIDEVTFQKKRLLNTQIVSDEGKFSIEQEDFCIVNDEQNEN